MRTALRVKAPQRQRIATIKQLSPPVGGWNARDALADMPITDAVALDNFMPKASFVELRGGYVSHVASAGGDLLSEAGSDLTTETGEFLATEDTVTNILGTVKTLAVYNALTGNNQLFAMTEQGVFNITTPGTAGSNLIARTNGKHQYVIFGDGTSQWLIAVNGVDDPLYYQGTSWQTVDETTSPALTGFPTNAVDQFISVNAFKQRLFFIPKNSLTFYYLPPSVAGGALLAFDLSSQCKRGGYLMAMGSWTRDAGDGQDDVAVFVTSEGEAIVYQGDNPSQANSWSKIGAFFVGRPLGRRCLMQLGGDLLILTENGAFPLSTAMQSAIIDYRYAISSKIERAFTDAARGTSAVFGWEAVLYPAQQALIVNVPIAEDGLHYQYVMNTLTKAWCRFLAWNAETFAIFNRELYFARGNGVFRAWTGSVDGTDIIEFYGKQAFTDCGQPNNVKAVKFFRPFFSVNGSLNYSTDVDLDFQDDAMVGTTQAPSLGVATWGTSQWGTARWGGTLPTLKQWTSVAKFPGFYVSGKVKGATNSVSVQWMASSLSYEVGGML
jgi:hypothetical protein